MRILHIFDHSIPLHSGYAFRSRAILEQQRAFGWDTFHVTSIKQLNCQELEETIDGLHFYRTPQPRGALSHLPVVKQWAVIKSLEHRLSEIITQVKPDILHAHSPALNGLAAVRVGRRFNLPVVYEIRAFWEDAAVDHGTSKEWGMRYRLTRALETSVVKRADAVTTICEGLRSDLLARGIPANKITVIPNAVDPDRFTLAGTREESLAGALGLAGKSVLGFIGSFYAYEGLPLLLRAMPQILAQAPDTRLLLVGGGPQEEEIRRVIAELGLERQVILTGRIPHDQVQAYYDLVDVLVYPRLSMRLTDLVTPLKPLEAMAQGRLVVASDVGGHQELIRNGENGVLFSAGDPSALSSVVVELLKNPQRWPVLRENGRRYVEKERNWTVSVGNYRQVYERLARVTSRRRGE